MLDVHKQEVQSSQSDKKKVQIPLPALPTVCGVKALCMPAWCGKLTQGCFAASIRLAGIRAGACVRSHRVTSIFQDGSSSLCNMRRSSQVFRSQTAETSGQQCVKALLSVCRAARCLLVRTRCAQLKAMESSLCHIPSLRKALRIPLWCSSCGWSIFTRLDKQLPSAACCSISGTITRTSDPQLVRQGSVSSFIQYPANS